MADIGERLGGDDIHFTIDQPLRVIIGGPPHSGKSTLMNLLEDRFRYYQIPVELLDLDLSSPTPLKTGFTEQREKKTWTSTLADEARSMFEEAEGVQVVLGDSVGLISEINEIISQPADVAILLVSGGHGDYDTTYRKVVRKWKEYYEDIHKPLLVVLRSTMNPADESMFDPQDNYGVIVGMDRDAYDENTISGHYRYEGLYPSNACLEGIVFEIAQSFDMKVRSPTDPEHLALLNSKWPELKDKKTWTPPAGSMLGGIERAYFQERGRVPADQRAESFGAEDDLTYIPIYFDDDGEVEVLGIHNQKTKAIASIMESIRKIFEEEKQVGNYGEETFEEFYEYGIEFDKNIDQWGDGSGGIWLIEEYSKTGDDTAWNQGLNRLHKKVFYNESFGAEGREPVWVKTFSEERRAFDGNPKSRTWVEGYFSSYDAAMKDAKEEEDAYRQDYRYVKLFEKDGMIRIDVRDKQTTTITYQEFKKLGAESFGAESTMWCVCKDCGLEQEVQGDGWRLLSGITLCPDCKTSHMDDYGFPVICDDCGVEANLEADNWGLHSGVVVCENCAQSEEYEYLFDAETFGAEDDLTFQEWADQEMMTHGKPEPFDDWLDDELSHHGDNVSLHDWGNHELDSHYERYGAENMTRFEIMPSVDVEGIGIVSGPLVREYSYLTGGRIDNYDIYDDDAAEEIMSIPANDPRFPLQEGELELIEAMVYGFNHPRINDSWGELNEDGMFWATKVMETLSHYQAYAAEMANWSGRSETVSPYYRGYRLKRETSPSIRSLESRTRRRIKQEAAYSQMMIASLIGLGAGLWGVSKWRDSQRSL